MGRVLIKSAWGSDDQTRASLPFLHAAAFADLGHDVQIFLVGEAVGLLRSETADAVTPLGWAPLREALDRVIDHRVPTHL